MTQQTQIIKQQLEEVIKKNLPEKKEEWNEYNEFINSNADFNQALSQINPSLIADEVLKITKCDCCDMEYELNGEAIDRLKEIIKIAHKLHWIMPPQGLHDYKGEKFAIEYPLMILSEVEKCMLAMVSDKELKTMREWEKDLSFLSPNKENKNNE